MARRHRRLVERFSMFLFIYLFFFAIITYDGKQTTTITIKFTFLFLGECLTINSGCNVNYSTVQQIQGLGVKKTVRGLKIS